MYMNGIWNLWHTRHITSLASASSKAKYQIHIRVHMFTCVLQFKKIVGKRQVIVFVYLCICVFVLFVLFNCLRGWRYGGERLLIVTDCRVPLNPGMATKTGIKISRRQNTVKRYPVIQNWNKYNELKWYPVIQNWNKDIKMI